MFSGIIKNNSRIEFNQNMKLGIRLSRSLDKKGDSLAINGVCLTLANKKKKKGGQVLSFDLSDETLEKSTLNKLKPGQMVNLERALKVSDVLGGHLVQGHVDGVGTIRKIIKRQYFRRLFVIGPLKEETAIPILRGLFLDFILEEDGPISFSWWTGISCLTSGRG